MKKLFSILTTFAGVLLLFIYSCNTSDAKKDTPVTADNSESLIDRGEYLVSVIGCDDCHSPKKMTAEGPVVDMDNRFSGYPAGRPFGKTDSNLVKNGMVIFTGDLLAAAGPWGISYAANISSDETGIGSWTQDQFRKALKEGKWKGMDGNRSLLPPMPWQSFRNLHDEDINAILAYLKTSKPIKNTVPEPSH